MQHRSIYYIHTLCKPFIAIVMLAVFVESPPLVEAQTKADRDNMRRALKSKPSRYELTMNYASLGVGSVRYEGGYEWATPSSQFCGNLGASLTHWLGSNIGLSAGLNFSYNLYCNDLYDLNYNGSGTVILQSRLETVLDTALFHVGNKHISDVQVLGMVQLPLRVEMRYGHIFGALGFMITVPVISWGQYSYAGSVYELTEYQGMGVQMADDPLNYVEVPTHRSTYRPLGKAVPLFFNLTGEIGAKHHFDIVNSVAVSLFGSISLNAPQTTDVPYKLVSITNDVYDEEHSLREPMMSDIVDRLRYYEVGIRIAYHFGFNYFKRPMH
ncbi:MAG: hypothetical protein IJ764_00900 [Bacteroidales bacterium]|nr:hypothetical protein [Bacteroidales bacterium]